MKTYFTYRPLQLGIYLYTPNDAFVNELNTIHNIKYTQIATLANDNRVLASFECESEAIKQVIIESLVKYSYHEKSLKSAASFIQEAYPEATVVVSDIDVTFTLPKIELGTLPTV